MTAPICRCGREDWRHQALPINSYSPPCRTYTPMDFTPFESEIAGENGMGCHCELCNQLKYAVSLPQGDWVPLSNTLYDALLSGTHAFRSSDEWAEKLRADSPGGRGYQTSGSFMASGMGMGVTLGGINNQISKGTK